MVNINDAFPSKYLKASDLQDRPQRVKMNYVKIEEVGEEHKPALYFIGKEKGIILNKTNANTIAELYGDDTEEWSDQEIEIYPSETDYQGKRVPCIRVRAPSRQAFAPNARARAEQAPQYDERNPPPRQTADLDDEIPF